MNNTFTTAATTIAPQPAQAMANSVSGIKDGMEQTQAKMRGGVERAMTATGEMLSFGRGNFEAFARSSQIFTSGMQELTQRMAVMAKATMDETISTMKALSSVKSLKEAADMQLQLARATMDQAMAQSSVLAASTMELTEQAFAPIGARMTLTTEKFTKTA